MMTNEHRRSILAALGALPSPGHPSQHQPRDAYGRFQDPLAGRVEVAPRLTLNGGYSPPPPVQRDHSREHTELVLQMAATPRPQPNLEKA